MKRFGEAAAREAIANGAIIRAWDFYTLNAGYRVIIDGEQAGYIVSDLFFKLKSEGVLVKDYWAHSYTDYKAAQEITTAEAAEMVTDALRVFESAGVISNLKVESLSAEKIAELSTKAAEAEKTAQEWTEESERVEAATLAALAPVIAAEEAAPAAEAAQEAEEAEPEYLEERWPESNTMPGICYVLEWNTPGSTTHHTGADSVADVRSHIQQIKNQGGHITKAVRFDKNAGKHREFIPETSQEKTDRENREHCKRIAEELEEYADGNVYRCPECGREHTWDQIEASEHEDECGWAVYTCPDCGEEIREDAWEQLSLYDYFSDCLDIEYRCGSDREYRSAQIMVACGGPNIYIDTAEKAVLLYWWTDRARYYLSSDACEAVDDWAREYWECI